MAPPARRASPVRWGEPPPGLIARTVAWLRSLLGGQPPPSTRSLPELPMALRRSELAASYLTAEAAADHPAAGNAATAALQRAVAAGDWWPADTWGHRALWHFEQAGMELEATRAARLIGDLRSAAGDPLGARRYYAEAISEARDLGAEREQGLAARGLGRAAMDLAEVTTA